MIGILWTKEGSVMT